MISNTLRLAGNTPHQKRLEMTTKTNNSVRAEMMDLRSSDADLYITCTDGDACQCESCPSHLHTHQSLHGCPALLAPPPSSPSLPPSASPSEAPLLSSLGGAAPWRGLRRRCLSHLVGQNQAGSDLRLLTLWLRRRASVWHRCSLESLSEFSQVQTSRPSTVFLFWGHITFILAEIYFYHTSSLLLTPIKLKWTM